MAEELIGSMPEALARAYQYLAEKQRALTAPWRAGKDVLGVGAASTQDALANMAASIMGAQRPDPNASTAEAAANATPSLEEAGNVTRSLTDALKGGRQGALNVLGWRDAQPQGTLARTPVNAAELADPTSNIGALPMPRRSVTRPAIGALSTIQTPDVPAMSETTQDVAQPAAVAAPQVTAPAKNLRDEFVKRLAGMDRKGSTGMTEEQKGQALLEAGLAIMAAGSKPGASLMGSIGQGGMQGTAVAREMERINREQADKRRGEDRADVRAEFDLAGRDEDRTLKKEDLVSRAEDRKSNRAIQDRHMDILEEQVRQGKAVIKEGDGVWVAIDTKTNKGRVVTDANGRPLSTKPKGETEDATVKRIKAIAALTGRNVGDVADSVLGDKSAESRGAVTDKDIFNKAAAIVSDAAKSGEVRPENIEAFFSQTMKNLQRAAGKPVASGPKKISTQAEFDALPKGTEYIGPDGRRARK